MIDALLQVIGRLHPLVLHLPIGLLCGLALLEAASLTRRRPVEPAARRLLAWFAAVSAVLAAATGWLLGREAGYPETTLILHRWLGIAVAVLALGAAACAQRAAPGPSYAALLLLALAAMLPAGHLGAQITHGADFVWEPLAQERALPPTAAVPRSDTPADPPTAPTAAAGLFSSRIAPIFDGRCTGCHGERRQKGRLALHSPEALRRGGKSGPVIVPGQPDKSELVRRLTLPLDDLDHMPPEDKPQPTADEIAAIIEWIRAGAPTDSSVGATAAAREIEPPSTPADGETPPASARGGAPAVQPSAAANAPAMLPRQPGPPAEALADLRARRVHVEVVDPVRGLLWIDFRPAEPLTPSDAAGLLEPLCDWVVDLSLARSPVAVEVLPIVARMRHLRRLDLTDTPCTAAAIEPLADLPRLEELVLVGARLDDAAVTHLAAMPSLRRVFVWRSGLSSPAIRDLKSHVASLRVDDGQPASAPAIETEPPPKPTSTAPRP